MGELNVLKDHQALFLLLERLREGHQFCARITAAVQLGERAMFFRQHVSMLFLTEQFRINLILNCIVCASV